MKKFLIIFMLSLMIISCKKNINEFQEFILDNHTAENSLDWFGKYELIFPNHEKKITIILKLDRTFSYEEDLINNPEIVIEKFKKTGIFNWDNSGFNIILKFEDDEIEKYFQVVEGSLIKLNKNLKELEPEIRFIQVE